MNSEDDNAVYHTLGLPKDGETEDRDRKENGIPTDGLILLSTMITTKFIQAHKVQGTHDSPEANISGGVYV